MDKFCKDCKHFRRNWILFFDRSFDKCLRPQNNNRSPITGKVKPSFADIQRDNFFLCGPEGKFWEAKNEVL